METKISDIIKDYKVEKTKHKFEFQELCTELEPIYGKAIWSLVYRVGFTEYEIRRAHKIAQDKGIIKLAYLIGIIKRNINQK